ncbi:hypothetical protein A2631_01670 [Candidatus Daviesbacteria bacterium RIFCSPHIGHO2_01_FULL_44_29]|uniref:DUF3267 domain-containing protein n=1 Tax=Candidatus Daviesbacteria bacterium RIFCSPHIGHO2_02_FULL_43_12 TaxID=1797776 RepID=A0A1F5KKG7_9BACT|nr:MAG: hypothetical protein A2631_01670 [Candidatus Daviesbacteria bacterium RIFCSPHIGHO2_01_FULL_44_29]OGE39045.1 MAG: hypothetical protein A3E86_00410 [Candidatus Daviesbacteria bacterium RIFCSPHIGHO2_12_FULL_47_45]OGE41111.1 MAG: hypothetical protein A3D25_01065 [Candidatus Daviesbacteria bacterium RIFCSPHIGHO2_02_FULL_43_12]OGE69310.1 MAG: hypothetical protein A3B55_02805 [Candidatus Daviesbacteria bacterium RIFCSPLOWO2_01_FULL_43_15]
MFFIPGWLISLVTFPGVIAHEAAHRFFCDLAKVPVYRVCYFRVGNPAGFVIHGQVKSLRSSFLISVGPLIVNTLLCMLLTFSAAFPLMILNAKSYNPVFMLIAWVGFSIGMHAFPSNEDMSGFLEQVKLTHERDFFYFVSKIFAWIIKFANMARIFWFDFIYAFAISMLLPTLLVGI